MIPTRSPFCYYHFPLYSLAVLRGALGICGVVVLGIFLCGVAVKKFPACGVAVISSLTVCDVFIVKSTVYDETKLSAVFPFP